MHFLPSLSSSVIALVRAVIGAVFLIVVMLVKKSKIDFTAVKKNLILLIFSGAALGFNWILLFESYRYTTVATSTLCYYSAPAFVIIASPFILKEKLSLKKVLCVIVSFIGMVFVSGVLQESISLTELKGVLFGIAAAVLYACIILLNKKMNNIPSADMTVCQLLVAAIVLLPYVILTGDLSKISLNLDVVVIIILLIIGIVHTGIAYALYFDCVKKVPAQTVALFSYIDPVFAIILSATLLDEYFGMYSALGAVLILGASVFGELKIKKKPIM